MRNLIYKYFDPWMGLAGAVIMAVLVFLINSDYGWLPATIAAMKQAAYTFIAGGLLMRMVENLAKRYSNRVVAYLVAILVPMALTVALTYLVHCIRGTPEPFLSTIPTIVLTPPSFSWWVWVVRNDKMSKMRRMAGRRQKLNVES